MSLRLKGLLAAVASGVSKAGARASVPNSPATFSTFSLNGDVFPYDVRPQRSDKLMLNLETDPEFAATTALVVSYDPARGIEQVAGPAGTLPIPRPAAAPREHVALIEFGNGQTRHAVELDIAEGTLCSTPTRSLSASLLNYSTLRFPGPMPLGARFNLDSQASAASLQHRAHGVRTMRVLVPLGLFSLGGAGPLTLLREANNAAQRTAAFVSALSATAPALTRSAAFRAAFDRVLALLPPS